MKHLLTFTALFAFLILTACQVSQPGSLETRVAKEVKQVTIGGKDWKNPVADTKEAVAEGATHFQHHCQICHGLDGQSTGVPFAAQMDPPVANLTEKEIQEYTDGQLKWIIQNGIAPSGMPAWRGILTDDEMWRMVLYIRHLPPKGSLGSPEIYKEEAEEHEHAKKEEEAGKTHVHKDGAEHKH